MPKIAEGEVNRLIDMMYAAANDEGDWSAVAERMQRLFSAVTILIHAEHNGPTKERMVGVPVGAAGADARFVQLYGEHYAACNILEERVRAIRIFPVVTDDMIVPADIFEKSEFFNDFLKLQDQRHGLFAMATQNGRLRSVLSAWRTPAQAQWGIQERAIFARLQPHFSRAISIHNRVNRLTAERDGLLDVTNRLRCAVVILRADNRILLMNDAAEKIIAAGDGITATRVGLKAQLAQDDRSLQGLIDRVSRHHEGGALPITRSAGKRPFILYAIPRGSNLWPGLGIRILIVDPNEELALPIDRLRRLYGLTPAEAEVARMTVRGQQLQEAAEGLGVTLSTVRVHLQRVFEKTETHRQADLVRLLLQSKTELIAG